MTVDDLLDRFGHTADWDNGRFAVSVHCSSWDQRADVLRLLRSLGIDLNRNHNGTTTNREAYLDPDGMWKLDFPNIMFDAEYVSCFGPRHAEVANTTPYDEFMEFCRGLESGVETMDAPEIPLW